MKDSLTLTYKNSKGKDVLVYVTDHAFDRIRERWELYYGGNSPSNTHLRSWLVTVFSKATQALGSKKLQNRSKRYKGATLYFSSDGFTFVVTNCKLVTVELNGKNSRHLNKGRVAA